MSTPIEKYSYLYSEYSISHETQSSQQVMIVSNNTSLWSRLTAWITNKTESFHQVDSSLLVYDTASESQLLSSKLSSSFSLASNQLPLTPPTSSLTVKVLSYLLFILTLIAVIIYAYQTGFYLVLLRNLQSTSSLTSPLYCENDHHFSSKTPNGSQSVDSSHLLALHTVLRDVKYSPLFPVDLFLNITDLTDKSSQNGVPHKCSHYSCFDIYRCGISNYQSLELQQQQQQQHQSEHQKTAHQREHFNSRHHHHHHQHIKVYVYPQYRYVDKDTGDDVLPLSRQQQSAEFTRLMKAVIGSRYFTTSAARACLFVVNLDLFNAAEGDVHDLKAVERILWSLPSFAALSGANHLLFSMLLPSPNALSQVSSSGSASHHHHHPHLGINIGQAMVAAAGLRLSTYRDQFDVSLPGYSLFGQLYRNSFSESDPSKPDMVHFNPTAISSLRRRWTVISAQAGSLSGGGGGGDSLGHRLQQLQFTSPDEILLLQSDCSNPGGDEHPQYISPPDPQVGRLFAHLNQHNNNSSSDNSSNGGNETVFYSSDNTAHELYTGAVLCNPERQLGGLYLDLLHSAEFCLIVDPPLPSDSPSSWALLLSDALMSGCIPVLLADSLVMPFEAPALRIDWATASIRIWEHSASQLLDILGAISASRRAQLRANGLAIWREHFASIESIAATTLDLINERVYPAPRAVFAPASTRSKDVERLRTPVDASPHQLFDSSSSAEADLILGYHQHHHHPQVVPAYRAFRQQSFDFFSTGGYHYIAGQEVALRSVGFTAVILSFNRPDSLMDVILSVSRAASCTKIVVVWNGDTADLLKSGSNSPLKWPTLKGGTPIQVVVAGSNRLSNRFYPYESIETEAVFSIDDDIGMLTADEIEFAYQTWRLFPDRIVGFPSRRHFWANRTTAAAGFGGSVIGHNRWTYDSEWRNDISLILTGAAFYHSVSSVKSSFMFF